MVQESVALLCGALIGALAQSAGQKKNPAGVGLRGGSGAGKRSRTPDLRITNALLYQLSYSG